MAAYGERPKGPTPYGHEPLFTDEEIAIRRAAAAEGEAPIVDRDPPSPVAPDRMTTNEWCLCGSCQPIDSHLQCVCCWEVDNCRRFIGAMEEEGHEQTCITGHVDFPKVCKEKAVLRTALVARLDTKGHRANLPAELDNESNRYAAYRFFTYWTHGILGRGVRKVIPACAVINIRTAFPSQTGIYKGFRYGANGEEVEVFEQLAI